MNDKAHKLIGSLFRILLIIILSIFLYLYSESIKSSRYINIENIQNISSFDTKTGITYYMRGNKVYKYDPVNGVRNTKFADETDETEGLENKEKK